MSLLKSVVSNIEKEKLLEEKKNRQLRTNPFSISFDVKFPVIQKDCSNKELQKRLAQACRDIGDVQPSTPANALFSDAYIMILSNKNNPIIEVSFQDIYPISL